MEKTKRELLDARRKANQAEKEAASPPMLQLPEDNRVRTVSYTNRDGKRITQHCQDFKVVANDANTCGIMWMGDRIEGQPGHREIIGQTFGIREWLVVKEDLTWEEYLKKDDLHPQI